MVGYSPWGHKESDTTERLHFHFGFPSGSDGKGSACNVGDPGSIPGLERSPGEGNGNPLQYSCLGNPMDIRILEGYSPLGCRLNNLRYADDTILMAESKEELKMMKVKEESERVGLKLNIQKTKIMANK